MKAVLNRVMALAAALVVAASVAAAAPADQMSERAAFEQLAKKVRKELVTLPWYGVFDNLAYEIDGSTVTLSGQVVQPSTRKDAERRVKRLAGVERGTNPSIHIVVERGHLTLEGVVSNEGDRRLARALVSSIPGVFSVTNN